MASDSHTVSSLLNGVSQQPAISRSGSQLEVQEDCYSDLVNGLSRRPPLKHVCKFSSTSRFVTVSNCVASFVERDPSTKYVVVVKADGVSVVNVLTGATMPVTSTAADGFAYLNCIDPKTTLRVLTVGDYTFVVNRNRLTHMGTEAAMPGFSLATKTVNSIQNLETTWTPGEEPSETTARSVTPVYGSTAGKFWVAAKVTHYGGSSTDPSTGYWYEIPKPGTIVNFDPATMPHAIVNNGDGTFTFKELDWGKRNAGDSVAMPPPSFINRAIDDVFFLNGRLGWISGAKVILSRSGGDFFNFWRQTGQQVLDNDPIDFEEVHPLVGGGFTAAVAFNQTLILWSGTSQFALLSSTGAISPNTIYTALLSAYQNSPSMRPVVVGNSLYYANDRKDWAQPSEYTVQTNYEMASAASLVDHVPQYVPANLKTIAGSSAEKALVALSVTDPTALYVFSHLETENGREQASWSRWNMPTGTTVAACGFIGSILYCVTGRDAGAFVEAIDLAPHPTDGASYYTVHLDHRVSEGQVTMDYAGGKTTFTLPYSFDPGMLQPTLVAANADPESGALAPYVLTVEGPNSLSYPGDWRSSTFFIGVPFKSWFELSEIFAPADEKKFTTQGELSIHHIILGLRGTPGLSWAIYTRTDEAEMGLNGGVVFDFPVGETPAAVEAVSLHPPIPTLFRYSGKAGPLRKESFTVDVPINMPSRRVALRLGSTDHLPFHVLGYRWEGQYTSSKQRI